MDDSEKIGIEEATKFLETPIGIGISNAVYENERLAQALLLVLVRSDIITNSDVQRALDAILIRDLSRMYSDYSE